MVNWHFQMKAACWAAFPCLSDTSVLLSPQNQLSMKTKTCSLELVRTLSEFYLCRCCSVNRFSAISAHLGLHFWSLMFSFLSLWNVPGFRQLLLFPKSTTSSLNNQVQRNHIQASGGVIPTLQPQTGCNVNGNPLGDCAWAAAGIPFSFPVWKLSLQYNSPSITVRLTRTHCKL